MARIGTVGWPLSEEQGRQYGEVHSTYTPDAWICGRATIEQHFAAGTRSEAEVVRVPDDGPSRDDFLAPGDPHRSPSPWTVEVAGVGVGQGGGSHVVAVLSDRVPNHHLATLRERGVSYLLAGPDDIDLAVALEKIGARLGVLDASMLEGGCRINGSFLRWGFIDEVQPARRRRAWRMDGSESSALFDVGSEDAVPWRLALERGERRADDALGLALPRRAESRGRRDGWYAGLAGSARIPRRG